MRLHRFFINEKIANNSNVDVRNVELSNQLRRVFRLKRGDSVVLFDNSGFEYTANIKDMRDDFVSFDILKSLDKTSKGKKLVIFCSIIKKDKFEWVVEKATELGIDKIYPVVSERSEKKNLNMDRLNKIAIEASEQSGRVFIPEICNILNIDDAISLAIDERLEPVVFHTGDVPPFVYGISASALFIGPEGGFTEGEIEKFNSRNIPIFSLGNNILKTETAAIIAISKFI